MERTKSKKRGDGSVLPDLPANRIHYLPRPVDPRIGNQNEADPNRIKQGPTLIVFPFAAAPAWK